MTGTPNTKGEQTRLQIIHVAHDLFVKQGYHGTSMRQIARQAGIALGGIYNHFSGKESVFQAVFLQYHPYQDVLPALSRAKGGTVEELVHDAFSRMLGAIEDRPDFLRLVFIEIVEFGSVHANELFATLYPQAVQIIQRILEPQRNRVRPLPRPMLYRTFLGLFFSYYLTEILFAQQTAPGFWENAKDHFVEIYLHGILNGEA